MFYSYFYVTKKNITLNAFVRAESRVAYAKKKKKNTEKREQILFAK